MRAGPLDRRITLQEERITGSPSGGMQRAWVDVARVWAGIRPLPGKERWQAPQAMAVRSAIWRIRWRPDVHERMRFLYRGEVWRIDGLSEIGRREGIEIAASALEGDS